MSKINDYLKELKTQVSEVDVKSSFSNKKRVLIDIREKDELSSGSPRGAIRISKGLLEMQVYKHISSLEDEIHLICASGRRSLIAAYSLLLLGFKNVASVGGGFKAWKDQGLPFEIPKMLDALNLERYKRHILVPEIGEKGQLKLLESKVLIVGAGGIGSPIAWYLAAAGVGTIGIIDDDIVDRSNLQRQILHNEKNIGNLKVESAKEQLQAFNSGITIKAYGERLNIHNVEKIFADYDIVLDGTDNFNTRYLINDACVKLGIPNIHGSVFKFEGQFTTFWPASPNHANAPCYRCLYPSPPPAELAPSCAEAGVLGVLPGTIGLLCATEAVKILLGFKELMIGKLLVYNAKTWEFDFYDIENKKNCVHCGCKDHSQYPAYSEFVTACSLN